MATSGTDTLTAQRDLIVRRALRIVGAFPSTDNPRPEQMTDAISVLNLMLKAWSVEGFLWLRQFCTIFLLGGTSSYDLGPSAHAVTAYTTTTLAADASAGAGSVTLTTGHGLTTSTTAWIGIRSTDTVQWFQGYTISGDTLTLTAPAVLASDVSEDDTVYAHTAAAIIDRPTHVFAANRKSSAGNEIPIISLTRADYMALPNKTSSGTPVQYYYDPQTTTGKLYIWPTPATSTTDTLVLDVDRQIDIMNSDLNDYDFPPHWLEAITYCLAERLAPEYGVPLSERATITNEARSRLAQLSTDDRDVASIYFGVSR